MIYNGNDCATNYITGDNSFTGYEICFGISSSGADIDSLTVNSNSSGSHLSDCNAIAGGNSGSIFFAGRCSGCSHVTEKCGGGGLIAERCGGNHVIASRYSRKDYHYWEV